MNSKKSTPKISGFVHSEETRKQIKEIIKELKKNVRFFSNIFEKIDNVKIKMNSQFNIKSSAHETIFENLELINLLRMNLKLKKIDNLRIDEIEYTNINNLPNIKNIFFYDFTSLSDEYKKIENIPTTTEKIFFNSGWEQDDEQTKQIKTQLNIIKEKLKIPFGCDTFIYKDIISLETLAKIEEEQKIKIDTVYGVFLYKNINIYYKNVTTADSYGDIELYPKNTRYYNKYCRYKNI